MKKFFIITFLVLLIDQSLKIYIKTHFKLGENVYIFGILEFLFIENPGMAYGWSLYSGYLGKIILSIIRLFFSIFILIWTNNHIRKGATNYFIIPISLIFAGAIGNLIDNIFYGLIFDTGTIFSKNLNTWISYPGISKLNIHNGYSFFMGGCVVDMISFKGISVPSWIPILGGYNFNGLYPIFNIADTSITIGILLLCYFFKQAFNHEYHINKILQDIK